ncbi:unnamed protein product [Zymoseptoria tritici ST99CH_3D7]|uniref:Uncharacterized protein n=1 Tax=Zymoseptoria tritici (strain ST99CH_3D7) TaxID=1276538 RepID=A0A1X7RES3_ZYMT9|nr:unnamed protein product [Zymoseptoria tritici ST99CH_3D7]
MIEEYGSKIEKQDEDSGGAAMNARLDNMPLDGSTWTDRGFTCGAHCTGLNSSLQKLMALSAGRAPCPRRDSGPFRS